MATTTKSNAVPIGTGATGTPDSLGSIEVPAEHCWGAQTQRSLIHFSIGDDHMPKAVYHAYGYVKKAAALVNQADGRLDSERAEAIGGQLFLSPRTVEWHLRKVFGKLGISSRKEPRAALSDAIVVSA